MHDQRQVIMKVRAFSAMLLALASSSSASAQGVLTTWAGFHAGVNAGGARNKTCNTWTANGPLANTAAFNNRDCPNNTTGVGGAQVGYDVQYQQWVWGFGLDYDSYSSKTDNRSLTYTRPNFPDGTYAFSGKNSPSGFAILGPRVGYAFDDWLPYFRAGGVFTSGSSSSTATYTPTGAAAPTATFDGGRNYKSHGIGVGVGVESALAKQWSVRVEYTHVNLGKGSNTVQNCSPASVCGPVFTGFSLDSIHNSLTFSVLRVGINYLF